MILKNIKIKKAPGKWNCNWDLAPLLRCKMRTHSHKHNVPKRILINLQIISVNFFPNLQRQIDTFSKNLM